MWRIAQGPAVRRRRHFALVALIALAVPISTGAQPNEPEDREADPGEAQVRQTLDEWRDALVAHDVDAVLAMYADDFRDQDGGGKAALRQFLVHAIESGNFDDLAVDIDAATINVDAAQAHVTGVVLDLGPDAPSLPPFQLTLVDEADAWLIREMRPQGEAPPSEVPAPADDDEPAEPLELLSRDRQFVRNPGFAPRPAPDAEHVPLRTSYYMRIGSGDRRDRVRRESVHIELEAEGADAEPIVMLAPGEAFGEGFDGEFHHRGERRGGDSLVVFIEADEPLEPETRYTLRVEAESYRGATLPADEARWPFTTEAAPRTHRLERTIDLAAEPDVHWHGEFFNGFAKPSFATSTGNPARLEHYRMMAEARETYPHAWNLFRDAYLAGFEHQRNPFKAFPNIVRERETRRITAIGRRDDGVLLRVEDFFGHEQYGIESDRPVSEDYRPGHEILIADGRQSARAEVIAADDDERTVLVTHFDEPDGPWQIEYPRPLPTEENPDRPGLFPPGGTYLRMFDPVGTPHYYWGRLHHEWDLLHEKFGFRMIPRFASAPGDLAIDGRSGTTAKCLVQLHQVTYDITSHIIERYGDATLDWPWVVLNEPDLMNLYWRNRDWEELQRFYDYTADAILRAFEDHGYDSNEVQVGGLELGAIAGTRMRLEEFLTHVSPNATGEGALEFNAAYADERLDGKRSQRVEELCGAHDGRGSPFDFLSIHTYNDAEMAADKLIHAKEVALEIDPDYFETLPVVNHETVPGWRRITDPGAAELYLGNGYFPTWGAHLMARLLQQGAEDPRYAHGGESPLMAWPNVRQNFSTLNDLVRRIRLEDGDAVIPSPMFHFVNLLSTMRDEFRIIEPQRIGGHAVAGFTSMNDDELRILVYSHHIEDTQSRSNAAFAMTLTLANPPWAAAEVAEHRFDRQHNTYHSVILELREDSDHTGRERDRRLTASQLDRLKDATELEVTAESSHQVDGDGELTLQIPVSANGANLLIVREGE